MVQDIDGNKEGGDTFAVRASNKDIRVFQVVVNMLTYFTMVSLEKGYILFSLSR